MVPTLILIAAGLVVLALVGWLVLNRRRTAARGETAYGDVPPDSFDAMAEPGDLGPAPAASAGAAEDMAPAPPDPTERLAFHTYWHNPVPAGQWRDLLVYIVANQAGLAAASQDALTRLEAAGEAFASGSALAREAVAAGAQVTVCPELVGFRFDPPVINIELRRDWHLAAFRMQAPDGPAARDGVVAGRVNFYVGTVLVGEVALAVRVDETGTADMGWDRGAAAAYRRIFVSYSHQDTEIVSHLEAAYTALGDTYLRDIKVLRSGEVWSEALEDRIREADVFQLCWSRAASQSTFVTREWQYALGMARPRFIRPVYWRRPMPDVPLDLGHLHFAYLPLRPERNARSAEA